MFSDGHLISVAAHVQSSQVGKSWETSEKELIALVLRLETWALESRTGGYLMEARLEQ